MKTAAPGIRIFAIILFFLVVFTGPSLRAPFSFEDEHEYVKIANSDLGMYSNIKGSDTYFNFKDYLNKYQNQGRFKPASLGMVWLASKLSKGEPLLMRIFLLLVTAITLFMLFKLFNEWGLGTATSLLSVLLFFAGPYNEIFYRIGPSELYGVLFLFSGLYFYSKYRTQSRKTDLLIAAVSLLLMALSKESFIPLLFLTSAFAIIYLSKTKFEKFVSIILIISSVLMGLCIVYIDQTVGSYRGNILSIEAGIFVKNFITLSKYSSLYFLIVFFCLPVNFITQGKTFRNALIYFLIFLILQTFVYRYLLIQAPVRYFLPALLPIQLAAFYSLKFLETKRIKQAIYFTILLAISAFSLKNFYIDSSYFSARATAYQRMLDEVAGSKADAILFMSDPATGYEFVDASTTFLSAKNFDPNVYFDIQPNQNTLNNLGLETDYRISSINEIKQEFDNYVLIRMAPDEYSGRPFVDETLSLVKSSFREEYFNTSFADLLEFNIKKDPITYTIYYPNTSLLLEELNLNTDK